MTIEHATAAHAEALAPTMRPEDVAEVKACGFPDGRAALLDSLEKSSDAWALKVDGEVAALFGVAPVEDDTAVLWLLTGSAFARRPVAVARLARRVVPALLTPWRRLFNAVDGRYTAALRLMSFLGFRLGPPFPVGDQAVPFVPVVIER